MDPKATIEHLLKHTRDGDRASAQEYLDDLIDWVEKSGDTSVLDHLIDEIETL